MKRNINENNMLTIFKSKATYRKKKKCCKPRRFELINFYCFDLVCCGLQQKI